MELQGYVKVFTKLFQYIQLCHVVEIGWLIHLYNIVVAVYPHFHAAHQGTVYTVFFSSKYSTFPELLGGS